MDLSSPNSVAALEESGQPVENRISAEIIGSAIEVQRHLGTGLIESAYELAFCHELGLRGLRHARQLPLAARYKDIAIPDAYRIDVVVEDLVVVEIKAIDRLLPVHEAQLLTYLRFSGLRLGLLLNFHASPMRSGVRRVVNRL